MRPSGESWPYANICVGSLNVGVNELVRASSQAASLRRGARALTVLILLQVNFTMSKDTTLADLLQLNLHKFEDEVHGIVDKAVKESGMEKVCGVRFPAHFAESPAPVWLCGHSALVLLLPGAGVHSSAAPPELVLWSRHSCCCLAFPWGLGRSTAEPSSFLMPRLQVLNTLDATWATMRFEHEPHARTGITLLKSDEVLIETLEDNQVQLQNLMTSKYLAFFLQEVSGWQQKLSTADSVISIWFEVQRTWSHLESIFIGSEDIRSQLPEDSKHFDAIDQDFKVRSPPPPGLARARRPSE